MQSILKIGYRNEQFIDDLTGLPLPPDLCRAARQKELDAQLDAVLTRGTAEQQAAVKDLTTEAAALVKRTVLSELRKGWVGMWEPASLEVLSVHVTLPISPERLCDTRRIFRKSK